MTLLQEDDSDDREFRTPVVDVIPLLVVDTSYHEMRTANVTMEPPQAGVSSKRSTQALTAEVELLYASGIDDRWTQTLVASRGNHFMRRVCRR